MCFYLATHPVYVYAANWGRQSLKVGCVGEGRLLTLKLCLFTGGGGDALYHGKTPPLSYEAISCFGVCV